MAVTLGGKSLPLPVLQGGMGVGVSLDGLAGTVAACGGMGTISAALGGFGPDRAFLAAPGEPSLHIILKMEENGLCTRM